MWCKTCRQDVPGVASSEEGRFCCAQCGASLEREPREGHAPQGSPSCPPPTEEASAPPESSEGPVLDAPPSWDDWELDERLGDIQRKLAPGKAASAACKAAVRREASKLESGHVGPPAWHCTPQHAATAEAPSSGTAVSGPAWIVLALGLMALVCGGVLLGWSVVTGRQELWARGIPFAVGGQVALLFGLVLQLERIWRNGQQTATRLEHVDEELHGLKSTTAMLGTTHSSAASSFYCHMAGGANSQLLLNDLKGQLDMLAVKIGQHEQKRAG